MIVFHPFSQHVVVKEIIRHGGNEENCPSDLPVLISKLFTDCKTSLNDKFMQNIFENNKILYYIGGSNQTARC